MLSSRFDHISAPRCSAGSKSPTQVVSTERRASASSTTRLAANVSNVTKARMSCGTKLRRSRAGVVGDACHPTPEVADPRSGPLTALVRKGPDGTLVRKGPDGTPVRAVYGGVSGPLVLEEASGRDMLPCPGAQGWEGASPHDG